MCNVRWRALTWLRVCEMAFPYLCSLILLSRAVMLLLLRLLLPASARGLQLCFRAVPTPQPQPQQLRASLAERDRAAAAEKGKGREAEAEMASRAAKQSELEQHIAELT